MMLMVLLMSPCFNGFRFEGKKVKKARETNRPVVNVQWLNEILFGHLSCMYQPENAKYQQFNINNPFRVDYNLVLHLMGEIFLIALFFSVRHIL